MAESNRGLRIVLIVFAIVGVVVLLCCGVGAWFANDAYQRVAGTGELPEGVTYSQWRDAFQSRMTKAGPAPQEYDSEPNPPGVTQIKFPSGNLQLKAWVHRPEEVETPSPALLFLHGGFAFGMSDMMACQPAMDRGFVVMVPALRGENGNPGNFEMMLGEVNDAKAAAQWLANQSYVDRNQIFVFGHSVGGGISAVLSLLDGVPMQHSGSSGGLYPPTVFLGWGSDVPFRNSQDERMARLLIGNIKHMQKPHFAYIGRDDALREAANMARKEEGSDSLLTIEMVPGDHFTSFDRALELYLDRATADLN